MVDLPLPLPNLFVVAPGCPVAADVYETLGYEAGATLTIWSTSEHVVDFVDQGGFRRATQDLSDSLQKWMSETPPPQVLLCGSRGGRLLSRAMAQGQAIPNALIINAMLYYLFIPPEQFDTLQFNIATEVQGDLDKGARDYTDAIPASLAPRTVLASSPHDVWMGNRFMPDHLLCAATRRLNDVHLYYNESDDHRFRSILENHEVLGALLRLAAHGNPEAIPATRVVDRQLRKGATICGLPGGEAEGKYEI